MDLFKSALQEQLSELQANSVRLQFMGQLHRLPPSLQQQCRACEAATAGNSGLLLTVAVSYSAQEDMAQAVQQLAQQVQEGQLQPQQVRRSRVEVRQRQQLLQQSNSATDVITDAAMVAAMQHACPPPLVDNILQ